MVKLFKRLTAKEVGMIVISILFTCLTVYLELEVPTYISKITELLQTRGTVVSDLWDPGLKMIGLSFASFLSAVTVGFIAARLAASFTTSLRSDIFNRVLDYSDAEIKRFSIPSLLTRTTNDLTQIQLMITMGLQVVTRGPIMAIWAITKIIGKSEYWLWAVIVAVIVNIIMTTVLMTLAFPKQSVIQRLTDKLNSITRESLTGIRVVRAYNAEDYQDDKFTEANDEVTRLNLFVSRLMAILNPIMMGISSGLTLAIYWIGAYLIQDAALPERLPIFSDMVVFMSYAMQVVMGFMLMGALFIILPRTLVSAGRINEVLELYSTIESPEHPKEAKDIKGEVVFDNVSFRYDKNSEAVIEHVSFTAKAGETVAFIGSTGSGKSTLISLIPRFYDVTLGKILVDGVDVRAYNLKALRQKIGFIPQKALLFTGTIAENIRYGKEDASSEELNQAADVAQARDFIESREERFETHLAEGGSNLSGGQKQRLSIARAVVKEPDIYIFDDSFSALDYKTDATLRRRLKEVTQDATVLIVAQRVGTIMDADQIIVLDKGEIVGRGRHEELMENNAIYREIANSQLNSQSLTEE